MHVKAIKRTDVAQSHLLDSMYQLRSRVFADRLGWDVTAENGSEMDEFDLLDPTYLVALTSNRQIAGCVRLLPATGPTMLEITFPELLATRRLNAHAGMVESSRFCIDTQLGAGRSPGTILHDATMTLFAGIIEWAMINGFFEIVTATDVRFERILRRAGWPMQRLGNPRMINETNSIAGLLTADKSSFSRVRPSAYASSFEPGTASCRLKALA